MKRAILPCLLLGLVVLACPAPSFGESSFYMDLNISSGNRYAYPGRTYYPPNSQPYRDVYKWLNYETQRYRQYDRWWYSQSSYYRNATRMQHDYARQLYDQMRRYPSWPTIQKMETFLQRYYDPYAYNYYNNGPHRDPYYGNGNYGSDYSYYPDDAYYYNTPRRQYYGDRYNYDRIDRETDYHAYGTGESINHIVRGSQRGNDLEIVAGSLSTAGNILNLVNAGRERDNRFGQYYNFGR